MKTKDFQKLLLDPASAGAEHLQDLLGLSMKYPYFQSAQLLLAKAAKEAEDAQYEDYLRKAALHSGDRKVLFDLLMSPVIREIVNQFDQEVDEFIPAFEEAVIAPELESSPVIEENDTLATVENETTPNISESEEPSSEIHDIHSPENEARVEIVLEVIEEEKLEELADEKASSTEEEIIKSAESDPELKALEREILYKAVYSTIEKEVQEDISEHNNEERPEQIQLDSTNRTAFTAWLLRRAVDTQFIEGTAESKRALPDRKSKEKNIINDFIRKDPRIAPGKPDQHSHENLGRTSIQEDEAFITETLARVYVKQGKIDKAKKAYQLLSLKYPEKSIYFANQLKKLDEHS